MATATTVTSSQPWDVQAPLLEYGMAQAKGLYQNTPGPQYYPDSTVAPLGQATQNALSGIINRGMSDPTTQAGLASWNKTVSGDYLNANPYLDAMYNNAARSVTRSFNESVLPNISAQFGMSGRSGSGLFSNAIGSATDSLGQNLAGLASNIYGNNYAQERQNQNAAVANTPAMAQAGFAPMSSALTAGQVQDAQSQAQLNDQVQRYQYNQALPYENLNRYMSSVGGGYGSSSSSTSPVYSNDTAQNVGLGLLGLNTVGGINGLTGILKGIFG